MFWVWRRCGQTVRRIKLGRLRSLVERQLFLTMKTFSKPLMELHAMTQRVEALEFCRMTPHHTYVIDEFKELQRTTREESTKPKIGEIADTAQAVRHKTVLHAMANDALLGIGRSLCGGRDAGTTAPRFDP